MNIDLTGKRYGMLVVTGYDGFYEYSKSNRHHWKCKCDCGEETVKLHDSIIYGKTTSCGCYGKGLARKANIRHGLSKTSEYQAWVNVRVRCNNAKSINYSDYGGRGIVVCDRWVNSFENFIEDMGMKPFDGAVIDRIDTNGDYRPDNCRWITQGENNRNSRKSKIWHIDFNTYDSLAKAAKGEGVSRGTILNWIKSKDSCWSELRYK